MVHSQTDPTGWRLTSVADSRCAETRTRVLKTHVKVLLTLRREGEFLVLAVLLVVVLRLTLSEPLAKKILKVLSRFFSSSASATPWKIQKPSQLFIIIRARLGSVFVNVLLPCAYRLLEIDLVVKYAQVLNFLQSGSVEVKQRSVQRRHSSSRTRQNIFRQRTLTVGDGGVPAWIT